jgi:hypothetical protein
MRDFRAGYTFNVTERKRILKEYMEVKEEGERELTGIVWKAIGLFLASEGRLPYGGGQKSKHKGTEGQEIV